MSGMDYDDAAAERLEAVYLGPDIVAQRNDTLSRLAIREGERVLDIGSGPGFLAEDLAHATGPSGKVTGVDLSAQMVSRAQARTSCDWLSYRTADATALPFSAESFDAVVSTQVAEYVPDTTAFCAEMHRVLKRGGRGLVIATDWDAVCWHSENPERMKNVMDAFAPHCAHSRLPRTLAPQLRNAGLTVTQIDYFPIINETRYDRCYALMIVPFISAYIRSTGAIPEQDLQAWADEQDALDARGEHFFSTGRFVFEVRKPD